MNNKRSKIIKNYNGCIQAACIKVTQWITEEEEVVSVVNVLFNLMLNVDFNLCPSAFSCLSPDLLCVQRQSSLVSLINLTDKKKKKAQLHLFSHLCGKQRVGYFQYSKYLWRFAHYTVV